MNGVCQYTIVEEIKRKSNNIILKIENNEKDIHTKNNMYTEIAPSLSVGGSE